MISCLILAAGQGSRLKPLTNDRPKGLVPLLGLPLVSYQIEVLKNSGVNQIAFATGFQAEKIEALGHPVFYNPNYDRTNMVESMLAARTFFEQAKGDILVSYSDIVYEKKNLKKVLETKGDLVVMVDDGWRDLWSARNEDPLNDAETLRLDTNDNILELGKIPKSLNEIEGQYTGLFKIARSKLAEFVAFYDNLDRSAVYDGRSFEQMYMTSFIQKLIDSNWAVKAAHVNHGWLEIDTVEDLQLYERLAGENRLDSLWRAHEN